MHGLEENKREFFDENRVAWGLCTHLRLCMYVLKWIEHLPHEEAASVFAHGSVTLTEVKEKTALDILHHYEDQIVDDTPWGFYHMSSITEVKHLDNTTLFEVLQNRDFVLHAQNAVFVSAEKLFFQDLDGHKVVRILHIASEVHFGSVSLTNWLQDLVLSVENWVFFGSLLVELCHFLVFLLI